MTYQYTKPSQVLYQPTYTDIEDLTLYVLDDVAMCRGVYVDTTILDRAVMRGDHLLDKL